MQTSGVETMTETSITSAADGVLAEAGTLSNAYVDGLACGGLSLEHFRRTQEQFYFAVLHFSRPMAALVARIPDPAKRLDILRNVVEEHGGFNPAHFHESTFRDFLRSIGASDDPGIACTRGCEVEAFNLTLDGVCHVGDVVEAVACLGIIEYAFADISAEIARGVVTRGWLDEGDLVHYAVHAEIDKRHAEEWQRAGDRERVMRGLRLGAHIFERLYRDLARTE